MIVSQDIFTKKEMFSNIDKPKPAFDGLMVRVVTGLKAYIDSDYYELDHPKVATEPMAERVVELTHRNSLATMEPKPKKKQFVKGFVKPLLKKIKKKMDSEEEKKAFQALATAQFPALLKDYKDFDVLLTPVGGDGEEGAFCLMKYEDGGVTPVVYFWKHALMEQKY